MEDDKRVESQVITFSNTVIDPKTVMIESINTSFTIIAMKTPRLFDNLAVRAQAFWIHYCQSLTEIKVRIILLDISRITAPSQEPNKNTDEK